MRKKCIHHNQSKRGPYPNPMRKRIDYDVISETELMRHAWYRREKSRRMLRDSLPNENRLDRE